MSQVKIISQIPYLRKKIEIKDFFRHFKQRFIEMKKILQEHSELDNLISINKISRNNQKVSIIGMVYDKRITKNNNIFLEVEDLTGRIRILINQNKKEVYEKAEDITLDSIIGFKCSGNGEILFANDIIFPDAAILERKKSPVEENVLFISDLHIGGKPFLEENFLKFIDYLNGNVKNTSEVEKIKYLFVVGDLVAGVGNYPNQEKDLVIGDVEEQYSRVAELFNKIRKDIKIIISPGNHDCVRLMEPQPILDEKYAWPLYNLKNVILTSNPSLVNIGAKKDFPGFNILGYHGFSFPYYANNISSLMNQDSINTPYKIMTYLLKNRHLAPTYTSVQNSPSENDELLMKTIPDIFVSSHLHKSSISYYNNILMISNSCWEALTPYQEKLGNIPDFCKVPMFNLKTRQVKILDFYEDENK
jgi:DNA polymerase II small subunit